MQPSSKTSLLSGSGLKSDLMTQSLRLPRSHTAYASTQLHFDYGRDVFLIREAVVGGERGGGAGQVHLSQAASLPVLLPPPRERSTAVTGKLHCPERGGLHLSPPCLPSSRRPSCPSFLPPPYPKHPCMRMKRTSDSKPLCSQPARLQFQTSLDHFSCSPEMNNAHINWCQLINFRLTALYFSIKVWRLHFVL